MDDQKIENLLNLALEASPAEREKSESLEVGYDRADDTWQVIIRYSGSFGEMAPASWEVTELSGGYAVVTLPGQEVDLLAALPQVEYVEKPKRLYFSVDVGRQVSCVSSLQGGQQDLRGQGVLVAVIDSGVDYFHPDFRREDGTTRILAMWDQSYGGEAGENAPLGRMPEGFRQGREYTKAEIDAALAAGNREAGLLLVPEQDGSGHGTEVLGIAAGNGRSSGGQYRGIAPESDILVVKLGSPRPEGFPRTTELMQAIEYVTRRAEELARPVAVNMSFGNAYGSHRGTSLLETYMDMMANRWKSVFVVGMGNEGNAAGHVSGTLSPAEPDTVEFTVGDREPSLNIQLWKNYADEYRISIRHPNGQMAGPFGRETGTARYRLGSTTLLVYYGTPAPYQKEQELFFDFLPDDTYLDSGVWQIILTPQRIVSGRYDLWMNDSRGRNEATGFLRPTPDTTMTIPSTASRAIAVGAYDARQNSYASFSGRGWPDQSYGIRPDLVAPGVAVTTTAVRGGYTTVTGTSFATPFVTGASAMLMQWGIVNGNDPYLYGEKVRAYLRRGARQLPGFNEWPNNVVGYGALCVRDSLPV